MAKLHLGTIGWSYDFWKGPFYPPKTASKDFLAYYSSKFNTVEVDSTFYRIPSEKTVANWRLQVPDGFLFALKFPQVITTLRLLGTANATPLYFLLEQSCLATGWGQCCSSSHSTSQPLTCQIWLLTSLNCLKNTDTSSRYETKAG